MIFKNNLFLFLVYCIQSLSLSAQSEPAKIKRVACVGDSITLGVGTFDGRHKGYPAQLQEMLGEGWVVDNFGSGGATLLKRGNKPYQSQRVFKRALNSDPDWVIIMLGTNDSKAKNWAFRDEFVGDFKNLIEQFKALPTKPKIFVCLPPYVSGIGNYHIREEVILQEIPLIQHIALDEGVRVIDMQVVLIGHDDLLPDRVHPNVAGANLLARAAFIAITANYP